jgi:hypothetical protein
LIEGDTDPLFLAPDDTTGQMIALRHQGELSRDSKRADDIEGRSGGGDIAHRAIDRAATELDLSGFQNPLPVRNPVLIFHRTVMLQKTTESVDSYRTETPHDAKASAIGKQKSEKVFLAATPRSATTSPACAARRGHLTGRQDNSADQSAASNRVDLATLGKNRPRTTRVPQLAAAVQ